MTNLVEVALCSIALVLLAALNIYFYQKHRWQLLKKPSIVFVFWFSSGIIFSLAFAIVDGASAFSSLERPFNAEFYLEVEGAEKFFQYIYFSFVTIATIGYGDYYPESFPARILVLFESAIGMGVIAAFAGSVIYRTTYQSSQHFVSSISFVVNHSRSLNVSINLEGSEYSVDSVRMDYCLISNGDGLRPSFEGQILYGGQNPAGLRVAYRSQVHNQIHYVTDTLPSSTFYPDDSQNIVRVGLEYTISSSASFTHRLHIEISLELFHDIGNFLKSMSAEPSSHLTDEEIRLWKFNLERKDMGTGFTESKISDSRILTLKDCTRIR